MRDGGSKSISIVASPVLVGAVTVLVVIVGVFLAYNANNGLPFVPTYELKAQIPNGQKLVVGNEIRLGGFLVGSIKDIKPQVITKNGKSRAIAVIDMRLQKSIEPLPKDTVVGVRPKSSLGLKYLDITPGKSKQMLRPGDTIPLSQAKKTEVEYEDVFSTFDKPTRNNARTALKGFGDALAGRGPSINQAIAAFNPFFRHLTPVMRTLANPNTHLENFFKNINQAAAQVAPVAKVQANLFGKMARTFDAISACATCLQQTIEKTPSTLAAGTASFAVQRPFLAEFTTLSKELRPTVNTLHAKLPTINSALEAGIPVLKRTPAMNKATEKFFNGLYDLVQNPVTMLALKDLHTTFTVLRPFAEYVAPYNTVCNNGNAFFTGLADHMSEDVTGGTSEVVLVKVGSNFQENALSQDEGSRPADVPSNVDPQTYVDPSGNHYQVAHLEAYGPAVDARGNADCQAGQYGYMNGPLNAPNAKYKPAPLADPQNPAAFKQWEETVGGGSHTSTLMDHPGLAGPTFVGRKLGIFNLKDVH